MGDLKLEHLLDVIAPPEAPPGSVRERLLASRSRPGKYGVFADRVARLFDIPLAEAEALMTLVEEGSAWQPFLVEGLDLMGVAAGKKHEGAIATLVRIPPGVQFPDHIHRGVETMVVLDGGFVETATKHEVWRGEEITRDDGTEHALVGLPGVPCIAAVLISGYTEIK